MRCFLSEENRAHFEERALNSFVSEPMREGHFRLYNKNRSETLHVRILGKDPNRYGWLVECDEVPAYFQYILKEENA
jgi:hypothetical protein